ncbi:MAG: hypothetical protein V3T30_04900, partial [Thermodesulfobacteriota bacterium]
MTTSTDTDIKETPRGILGKTLPYVLLAAVVTFIVYLPTLQNGFVNWDDQGYVYNNPNIRILDIDFFRWALSTPVLGNWHPLTMLSHAVDYALFGLNPRGHHLTSIVLHSVNTILVFFLTFTLVNNKKSGNAVMGNESLLTARITALVTALLFGLHPLHVESVAWVSERKDLLYAFFYLLTLLTYLTYARGSAKNRVIPYASALILFTLSLLSKPMAVTLPVVLLLIDYYPLGRFRVHGPTGLKAYRRIFLEKIPFFLLSLIFTAITIETQKSAGALEMEIAPFLERLLISLRGYGFYIYKSFIPVNLAQVYPYPDTIGLFKLEYLASIILIAIITLLSIKYVRKPNENKLFITLWAYFLVTLLPVIGLVQAGQQSAADRYTYLPGLAIFILIGLALSILYKKSKGGACTVFICALIILG